MVVFPGDCTLPDGIEFVSVVSRESGDFAEPVVGGLYLIFLRIYIVHKTVVILRSTPMCCVSFRSWAEVRSPVQGVHRWPEWGGLLTAA